jgi:large subunit ribosomal protein L19
MNELLKLLADEFKGKRASLPAFKAGDTINVHVKITEGTKERIQQYQGVVIQRKNMNTNGESFTVRKVSNGVGVERIFPLLSPSIDKIEMVRKGSVRRAKLFYLRDKAGKGAKIKEDKKYLDKALEAAAQ